MPFTVVETSCKRQSIVPPKYEARKKKRNVKKDHLSHSCKASFYPTELQQGGDGTLVAADVIKVRWSSRKLQPSHSAFETSNNVESSLEEALGSTKEPMHLVEKSEACNRRDASLVSINQEETIKISKSIAESSAAAKVSAGRLRSLLRRWSIQLGSADLSATGADLRNDADSSGSVESSDFGSLQCTTLGLNSCTTRNLWQSAFSNSDKTVSDTTELQQEGDDEHVELRTKESQVDAQGHSDPIYSLNNGKAAINPCLLDSSSTTNDFRINRICNCIGALIAASGFTHAKLSSVELLSDVLSMFLTEIAERMKQVKERELCGIGHGFPDPLERVLTDMGMRGTRGMEISNCNRRKPSILRTL